MSRVQLPEPWRSALEVKGVHSIRGLATKAGISPQTAKRLIDGTGAPAFETVTAVADALYNGDRSPVYNLLNDRRRVDRGPWQLPEEVTSQLDDEQRAAVLAVARAMLPAEVRKRGEADGDAAPTKEAGTTLHTYMGSGKSATHASLGQAARAVKKESSGQRARAAQDTEAEAPQD